VDALSLHFETGKIHGLLGRFAGVWTPGATMPDAARNVADFTPIGAASEAIADAWSGAWPTPLHLAVLVGCAVVASAAAARLFRWE
jgi:ABC-2 type transport system permease protein